MCSLLLRPFPSLSQHSWLQARLWPRIHIALPNILPWEASFRDRWIPSYPIYFWTRPQPLGSSRPYLSAIAPLFVLLTTSNSCLSPSIFERELVVDDHEANLSRRQTKLWLRSRRTRARDVASRHRSSTHLRALYALPLFCVSSPRYRFCHRSIESKIDVPIDESAVYINALRIASLRIWDLPAFSIGTPGLADSLSRIRCDSPGVCMNSGFPNANHIPVFEHLSSILDLRA